MRVLHLLPGGTRGGMETLVSRYMASSKHEHAYCALFLDGPLLDELGDGVEVYRLAALNLIAKRNVVKRLVESGRYDVVVSHQWFGKPAMILDSIDFGEAPLVVVLHSCYEPEGGLRDSDAMLGFTKRLYKKADRVVAISRFVERNHREHFGLDDRAVVVYNAVDGERFEAASDAARSMAEPMKLLYLGRLEDIKGVDVLIRACALFDGRGVPYDLTISGWGSQRDSLEALASELGVPAKFTGETQFPERCYAEADVFVHPAVCDEGFGLTTVEAMAAGCICVVSNVGGLPEIVDDGKNGFLFSRGNAEELANCLQRIASLDADEVRMLRDGARFRSRDFAWNGFVEGYDALIEECAAKDGRGRLVVDIEPRKAREGEGPLVSVVVPVYNVEPYLEECVESIRRQTLENIEIILVDDGSTDDCPAMCDRLAGADDRIRVIHRENGGLSAARNTGLAAANADVVSFVDSDDVVHPAMLQVLYDCLERDGSDVAVCRYERFEQLVGCSFADDSSFAVKLMTAPKALEVIYGDAVPNVEFVAWNKLYRKSLFEEHDIAYPEGRIHEDTFTTYRLLYAARSVSFVDAPLYLYRDRPGSIMDFDASFSADRLDALAATFEAYAFFEQRETALARAAFKTVLRTCIALWCDARNTTVQVEVQSIANEVYAYVWGRSSHLLDDEPAKKVLYGSFLRAPHVVARILRMM